MEMQRWNTRDYTPRGRTADALPRQEKRTGSSSSHTVTAWDTVMAKTEGLATGALFGGKVPVREFLGARFGSQASIG